MPSVKRCDPCFDKWRRQRHFVEAFCGLTTSDQPYPRIRSARRGAFAVIGVFPIDVTGEQVYEHFGNNNLRDLHSSL